MSEINESIKILHLMSEKLENLSVNQKDKWPIHADYFDQLAAEIFKITNELKEINYMFGGVL